MSLDETSSSEHDIKIYLESIINHVPHYIFWKDRDSRFLGCNKKFADSVGLNSPKEIIDKSDYDMPWPAEQSALFIADDKRVMETRAAKLNYEEVQNQADGTRRTMLVSKVPLFDDIQQKVIGLLGIYTDITERKKLEEQLKKNNELKTEFIQNMQHDLRTPTSGSVILLEELAQSEQDPIKHEKLVLLYNAAKKIHEVCNEIIDFENIAKHRNPILTKKFNLPKVVQGVIDLNKPAALTKNLSLTYEVAQNVPAIVKGDPKRLSRLLINLVGNAIKFTKAGSIAVSAKLMKESNDEFLIQFAVKDTGIGIPADKKDLIFEQFTRLAPSNEGYYKGSGLGLHIVKQYVEELHGEIDLQSQLNKGSTFYVTLPFKRALVEEVYDEEPLCTQGAEFVEAKTWFIHTADSTLISNNTDEKAKLVNILFIEDNPLARYSTIAILKTIPCNLTIAESAGAAFKQLAEKQFDLVVSDLGLPDGSGEEIVAAIKNQPTHKNYGTPFIALTAHSDKEKLRLAEQAGFLTVITKPLLKAKYAEIIKTYVNDSSLDAEQEKTAEEEQILNEIIDFEMSKSLADNKEELAYELLGFLAKEISNDLAKIKANYRDNDIEALRFSFHALKGAFSYCGVPRLQKSLSILHEAVKQVSQVSTIKSLFDDFYKEIDLFLAAHKKLSR